MNDKEKVVFVLTSKSAARILQEGGTKSWRLRQDKARRCRFVVCTRNASARGVEGDEAHRSAFLIGKVKDVVPVPDRVGRFLIQFSEYAEVDIPDVWKEGNRNPVRYLRATEVEINFAKLKFKPMPGATASSKSAPGALTLLQAKRELAITYGVGPENIEITVRA